MLSKIIKIFKISVFGEAFCFFFTSSKLFCQFKTVSTSLSVVEEIGHFCSLNIYIYIIYFLISFMVPLIFSFDIKSSIIMAFSYWFLGFKIVLICLNFFLQLFCCYLFVCFILIFLGAGNGTHGLALGRPALYHLSYTPRTPFFNFVSEIGSH
jgi:hypothetical protein